MPMPLSVPAEPKDIRSCHEKARKKFVDMLGIQAQRRIIPQFSVLEQYRRDGLQIHRIAITSPEEPGAWEAVILEPVDTSKRRPAWICTHGCIRGGMSAVTGLIDDTPGGKESADRFECDYGFQLAKRGYVTLSFHFPGFGSRSDGEKNEMPTSQLLLGTLHSGIPYLGWCVMDTKVAISILRNWPTVLQERIGLIGFSMGATIAAWTAAVDDRAKAVLYSGRVASLRDRSLRGAHPGALECLRDGVYSKMDKSDTIAIVAPKPMFISQEVRGDLATARSRITPITRAYEAIGAADALSIHYDERGPHKFIGEPAYRWIEALWPL
jgi:dienelactone hydrolase